MSGSSPTLGVGIIGYGFMGRTHAKSYQDAHNDGYACELRAVADPKLSDLNTNQPTGNIAADHDGIDPSGIEFFKDARAVLEHPEIDLVSICTHTDTHVDLAIRALNAVKHVLVEKPIAIDPGDVQRLATAAERSDRLCVPAMCMRHWPAWIRIRELIRSNRFGKVRSAAFHRLGSRPGWSTAFYSDQSRSGGVLHDLHIHDTDFIVHCFGKPDAVTSTGDHLHISTLYHYRDIPHVTAQGAWDHPPAMGFQMKCTIAFEHAALDFDFSRDPQLILHQGDESTPIETGSLTGYDQEVRWMLDQIHARSNPSSDQMKSAVQVAMILDAERRSIADRSTVVVES